MRRRQEGPITLSGKTDRVYVDSKARCVIEDPVLARRIVIDMTGSRSTVVTDRGSHYWHTPEAGGKVDRGKLTQFGRAMQQLGIEMIPAYSLKARGRSKRMFRTHQARLPRELALLGITDIEAGNRYLREQYMRRSTGSSCSR